MMGMFSGQRVPVLFWEAAAWELGAARTFFLYKQ
jgi:hypothetical protein